MESSGPASQIEGEQDSSPFRSRVTFRSISTYILSPARPFIVISVQLFATTDKLIEPRRFDMIGERKLAQQMSDVRRTGKRRALIVRDKKGGTTG